VGCGLGLAPVPPADALAHPTGCAYQSLPIARVPGTMRVAAWGVVAWRPPRRCRRGVGTACAIAQPGVRPEHVTTPARLARPGRVDQDLLGDVRPPRTASATPGCRKADERSRWWIVACVTPARSIATIYSWWPAICGQVVFRSLVSANCGNPAGYELGVTTEIRAVEDVTIDRSFDADV
jgi:hypothetical protein